MFNIPYLNSRANHVDNYISGNPVLLQSFSNYKKNAFRGSLAKQSLHKQSLSEISDGRLHKQSLNKQSLSEIRGGLRKSNKLFQKLGDFILDPQKSLGPKKKGDNVVFHQKNLDLSNPFLPKTPVVGNTESPNKYSIEKNPKNSGPSLPLKNFFGLPPVSDKTDKKKTYSKISEVKLITIGLASPKRIRQWAEKTLPNGKVVGQVMNANTLHHKTFKPQKGGLFCERIFGPLKDFECACGKIQKPNKNLLLQNKDSSFSGAKIKLESSNINNSSDFFNKGSSNSLIKKYCPICDVEYTWSVVRRYQLGYIQLASPVTHVWYLKGTPSYISILLDIKKRHLEYVTYCSETLTLENSYKGDLGFSLNNPSQIFSAWEKLISVNSPTNFKELKKSFRVSQPSRSLYSEGTFFYGKQISTQKSLNNDFVKNVESESNGNVNNHERSSEKEISEPPFNRNSVFSKDLYNFKNPINYTGVISNRLDNNNLKMANIGDKNGINIYSNETPQKFLDWGPPSVMLSLYYPFYKDQFYKKNTKKIPILFFDTNKQNSKNLKNLQLPKKRHLWRQIYTIKKKKGTKKYGSEENLKKRNFSFSEAKRRDSLLASLTLKKGYGVSSLSFTNSVNKSINDNKDNLKMQSPLLASLNYLPIIINNFYRQDEVPHEADHSNNYSASRYKHLDPFPLFNGDLVGDFVNKFRISPFLLAHNYDILNLISYNQFTSLSFAKEKSGTLKLKLPKKLEKLVVLASLTEGASDKKDSNSLPPLLASLKNFDNGRLRSVSLYKGNCVKKKIWKKMPICFYINLLSFLKTNLIWETYGVNSLIMDFLQEKNKDLSVNLTSINISNVNQIIALEYIKNLYNSDFGSPYKSFTTGTFGSEAKRTVPVEKNFSFSGETQKILSSQNEGLINLKKFATGTVKDLYGENQFDKPLRGSASKILENSLQESLYSSPYKSFPVSVANLSLASLIKKIPLIISSDLFSSESVYNNNNFVENYYRGSLFLNNINKPVGVITPNNHIYLGIITNTIEKAWKKIYKSAYQRAIYQANQIVYKIASKNLFPIKKCTKKYGSETKREKSNLSGGSLYTEGTSGKKLLAELFNMKNNRHKKNFSNSEAKRADSVTKYPLLAYIPKVPFFMGNKKPLIFYLMLKIHLLPPKKSLGDLVKKFLFYKIKTNEHNYVEKRGLFLNEFYKQKLPKKEIHYFWKTPYTKETPRKIKKGAKLRELKISISSIPSLILKSSQYANVQKNFSPYNFFTVPVANGRLRNSDLSYKFICENLCNELLKKHLYNKKVNTNKIVTLLYKQLLKPLLVLKIFSLYKYYYREFSNLPDNISEAKRLVNFSRNSKDFNNMTFYWKILYKLPNFLSLYKGFSYKKGTSLSLYTEGTSGKENLQDSQLRSGWSLRIKKIIFGKNKLLLSHKLSKVLKPTYINSLGTLLCTYNYFLPEKIIWVDNKSSKKQNWKKEFIYNIGKIPLCFANKNKSLSFAEKQFNYKRVENLFFSFATVPFNGTFSNGKYISNNNRKILTKKEKKIYNNIYSLSHRERWQLEKDWQFFILFMSAPSEFIDQTIPAYINRFSPYKSFTTGTFGSEANRTVPFYKAKKEPNHIFLPNKTGHNSRQIQYTGEAQLKRQNTVTPTNLYINQNAFFSGPGIIQQLLNELDFYSLKKMDKQNRILLYQINKQIFSIKKKFKYKYTKKEYLNKYKKRDQLIRRTKLVRKLFRTESNIRHEAKKGDFVPQSKFLSQKPANNSSSYRVEGGSTPNSMILTTVPVLPPDLRPIVQIGSQIAASDLNRLYQRVIYRNDRLKKFLKDPATTHSYEMKYAQRLLQEAVDNLIQNGKSGVVAEKDSRGRALKSLSDLLKGKQGRFRQYLLGKRVDYSGRSVIVVGPKLKLHECGIPKEMALELYLPFLLKRILNQNLARTVIGAKTLLKTDHNLTWELLREIMQVCPVLLNRAPTLHRLGIQAFQPKLVDGRAILLHPLVCPAFNADFDGDQMAVHVPITVEARSEAWKLMLSRNNLLAPATGEPLAIPSQDMVLGCYYLTTNCNKGTLKYQKGFGYYFQNFSEVIKAYDQHKIDLHAVIWVKWNGLIENGNDQEEPIEIRLTPHGNWQEINQQSQKTYGGAPSENFVNQKNSLLNIFISTTPGKILFNLIIKNCL